MSVRAFGCEVTDDDRKRRFFTDGKNLLDTVLNPLTAVMFVRANGAVWWSKENAVKLSNFTGNFSFHLDIA